ncbi:hypothetical protein GE21DRAFT_7144 [Neurospora crassa]|uniref:Uncharacterized protein n=2 Tax=Neurospora crassa TaxID=5141 RepID=V5IML3_NEUCR|nr:uncharacterized protein NCU16959 [Neurospora crassa OR74A]XP_011394820.1 hypothetical protein NCU16959 [Neurospora crassa OR74A]KHE78468.1 hypothetical protein GE21DRAFT_7144 [Neurospora crassa]ESA42414.1 hypothetical protein NCU16959 [Neurospora crassa OR74A]ESA42415.1 hypothetical protein, variant [Neurospora crassa OR74A]CAD70766.1 hypothetical protein [Neurospora crassa]|eukprot:XP_011394819.1 uncharacterized protein NCU16959 [Neurospora crassa OR74A]
MCDSSDDDDRPEIPMLQGEENFEIWECLAINTLKTLGLEGFIRGTETPPLGNTPEAIQALRGFKNRRWKAWNLLNQSILIARFHHLIYIDGYGPYDQLDDCDPKFCDPKFLWDGVQSWYNNIDKKTKLDFLRELTSIHYRQFGDIVAFLNRAQWLRRRLERAGMPIADEMMKTCLYGGVSPYYHSKTLETRIIERYNDLNSQEMISGIRKFSKDIQRELNIYQQEQQEMKRLRDRNGHSSGHGGGSRQGGRRY